MIDYSKVRALTEDEQNHEAEAEEKARKIRDTQRRRELSKKTVQATLKYDAEARATASGLTVIIIRGNQADGRSVVANYFVPEHDDHDAVNNLLNTLITGCQVTLAGYWKKRAWLDARQQRREVWEFMAQFVTPANLA